MANSYGKELPLLDNPGHQSLTCRGVVERLSAASGACLALTNVSIFCDPPIPQTSTKGREYGRMACSKDFKHWHLQFHEDLYAEKWLSICDDIYGVCDHRSIAFQRARYYTLH